MPLIDLNASTSFDGSATSLFHSGNFNCGLQRIAKDDLYGSDPDLLIAALTALGLTIGQRIVLVGAMFGWTIERFLELGYGPYADGTANGKLLAVDTSTWIAANQVGNAVVAINAADVTAATGRRTIRQQFGANNAAVDWVVSDKFLMYLTGAGPVPGGTNEIQPFCNALRSLATNVAHFVITSVVYVDYLSALQGVVPVREDTALNWKTLEQWKAWVTPDHVIAANEGGRTL